MPEALLIPPLTPPHAVVPAVLQRGYAVIDRLGVADLCGCDLPALDALRGSWNDLPPDGYLKDGGHYRRRRHSCYVVANGQVQTVAHRAHWQPLAYNALHGGMQRWFEPLSTALVDDPAWRQLLLAMGRTCSAARQPKASPGLSEGPWFVEAHQFRIDTTDGIGRPTPEGAHRDGVDFVAVFLIDRQGIKGGETRVFEANGPSGQRFTLTEPWSLLLLDDEKVIHETTPIQPLAAGGHRDTLVLTYRRDGFQGQEPT